MDRQSAVSRGLCPVRLLRAIGSSVWLPSSLLGVAVVSFLKLADDHHSHLSRKAKEKINETKRWFAIKINEIN